METHKGRRIQFFLNASAFGLGRSQDQMWLPMGRLDFMSNMAFATLARVTIAWHKTTAQRV
jgi:hypothetical protein